MMLGVAAVKIKTGMERIVHYINFWPSKVRASGNGDTSD